MDNISEQNYANNKQDDKLISKFQIQENIKMSKCKSRHRTTCKLYSPKIFMIRSMENKYFHSRVTRELREGIRTCVVVLPTFSDIRFKIKEGGDDIIGRQ